MKNFLLKISYAFAVCFVLLAFTSCNDNEGPTEKPFSSELIGSYGLAIDTSLDDFGDPKNEPRFAIDATWKDPENIPVIDMSFMIPGYMMPVSDMLTMLRGIVCAYAKGGLEQFDLKNDGTIGVKYHTVTLEGEGIGGILSPTFSTEVYTFPDAASAAIVPADAITYHTGNGKIYFAVNKAFLKKVGEEQLGMDLPATIEGLLEGFPTLKDAIIVTEETYELPLKYAVNGKEVTISVDKEMMKPFFPLLTTIVPALVPEEVDFGGGMMIKARDLVTTILNAIVDDTLTLEFSLTLERK